MQDRQISIQYFKTAYGELVLGAYQGKLCLCDWRYRKMRSAIDKRITELLDARYQLRNDPVIALTINQLEQYFSGQRQEFDLPLLFAGTEFQQRVWQQLVKVPYGITSSYLELSEALGNVKAIRAVATANGANAISIIVPCHRIIGSDGKLVGYAGGLDVKKKLLQLEACTAGTDIMTQSMELF
ncbi:cysteine methyltransferase ['Osedax' symbiont bacterium Rs2_46_30_T18]|nr:cysteine methyltransferase ['Osedax' symbiont bacterium Rs2_46_30_T18]